MILINGDRKQHIDVSDRGLQYGDGLFETIEVQDSQPIFLDLHLKRLQLGCQRLGITCPPQDILISEARQVCGSSAHGVLKIIVTRGAGGRGYKPPAISNSTRILSLHPFPHYAKDFGVEGINAKFCHTRLGANQSLAGIKHLNRLEQILGRAEWDDDAFQEGLMMNNANCVIEGTMSNLFYIKNGLFHTPSLLESGVAGIMREIIMKLLSSRQVPVQEIHCRQDTLLAAEEIFVCNSIVGIWPVVQLADRTYAIGQQTRQLQNWLQEFKTEQLT